MGAHPLIGASGGADPAVTDATQRARLREAEVLLLREEDARLKSARCRPADSATGRGDPRAPAAAPDADVVADADAGVWAEIADLMALREAIEQACTELEGAAVRVRKRLHRLLDDEDLPAPDSGRREWRH